MHPPQYLQGCQKKCDAAGCVGRWEALVCVVRDLGAHLDFTRRVWAGTLSERVKDASHGVAALGALPLGFQVKLGLARGKYL